MRSGKSLIHLAVIGESDGTQLGQVRDLIFDHEANKVLAVVVSEPDLFGLIDATVVLWSEVQSVGKDVLLVKGANSQFSLRSDERLLRMAETRRDTILSGTKILTAEGKQLGTLADMMIDEATGAVTGYEVSGGFIADSLHGKKLLPAATEMVIGKDAVIVPPVAETNLQKSPP